MATTPDDPAPDEPAPDEPATVRVTGSDGPVPFLDLFRGRDELVVYKHMWHDGAPHQG